MANSQVKQQLYYTYLDEGVAQLCQQLDKSTAKTEVPPSSSTSSS